jgi:hypothetical protein
MGDQPVTRPVPTHRTIETQNKLTQTSMPRVGFETTIPVFEQVKTVHALERVATVMGSVLSYRNQIHIFVPISKKSILILSSRLRISLECDVVSLNSIIRILQRFSIPSMCP